MLTCSRLPSPGAPGCCLFSGHPCRGHTLIFYSRDRALELLTRCVSPGFSQDSLAAEIEGTMRKELQLEESESPDIA